MRLLAILLSLCLLTGCSSLLEREYSSTEPHSSKYWESESAGTLRAESYTDIVNDLLILIGQHTETATLRLYGLGNDLEVAELLEKAIYEVQQETPLGSYAVEYITVSRDARSGHYEATVNISYRRSAEQLQSIVSATSAEALYSLLDGALSEGREELVVRMGYWGEASRQKIQDTVQQLRQDCGLTEALPWTVNYYPLNDPGLIEFLLVPTGEETVQPASEPVRVQRLIPYEELGMAAPDADD